MTTDVKPENLRLTDHLCKVRGTDEICQVYKDMWNSRKLFVVIKGGKGSGKSRTIALMWIYRIMKYPGSNLLVMRKVFDTLRTSCFTDLQWAINELGVASLWKVNKSPMEMTYLPTGQRILFKGLDKAEKVGSTNVVVGILNWAWIEEFFEISTMDEFDKLAFSIRGDEKSYPHLWFQIVCSMNPWSETWIKERFFDKPAPNVFVGTTTFRDNSKLNDAYVEMCENMYVTDPRRARVYCDGEFGVAEGLIYTNWEQKFFDIEHIRATRPNLRFSFGLDFGYAISFNAFVALAVDMGTREMWIFDEYYEHGVPNIDIAKKIVSMGYGKEEIWADAAEPKSIFELQTGIIEEIETGDFDADGNPIVEHMKWQLPGIRAALKGPDSVRQGIQNMQSFKIYVHPKCRNAIIEFSNYAYELNKEGKFTGKPMKEWDHIPDAARYACSKFFVRARGKVAEARGIDRIEMPTVNATVDGVSTSSRLEGAKQTTMSHKHVRRVYSTH